jgi:hypothetical protein
MFSFLKKNLWPIILILLVAALCFLNYTPKTFLTGWDTLHPEFNFPLNFQRTLQGVWRPEQGLGAVAGHSHMADLPRQVILWLFSFVFPLSFLRYFYFFACLFLGPLGLYFFLKKIVFSKIEETPQKLFSFLGALFYLFNLGTAQHFFVPFEMFATQYAFLGWLFLLISQYLAKPNKKTLVLFTLVSFLSTPQAYAATLWYAYFACLVLFLLVFLFTRKFKKPWPSLKIFLTTLLINSFWLFPNLYYVWRHSGAVLEAKINRLFSQEAFLHNYEYGQISSAAILKNHLFSWTHFNFQTDKFEMLLQPWLNHLSQPLTMGLLYLFFFLVILGLLAVFLKKRKNLYPFGLIFALSFLFLINATPPFDSFWTFLRNRSSLFREALRFPFTKFSLLLMFAEAVFLSFGAWTLSRMVAQKKGFQKAPLVVFGFLILSLLFLGRPAFQGQLINPQLEKKIPQAYFEAFDWFGRQGNGRILQLPLHSLWGWEYRSWGFQGAGFTWFGLKQPFLARDFDRWNLKNEKAYQELSYALYAQNLPLFEALLDKYHLQYILFDQSLIDPEHEDQILFWPETEELLASSSKIKKAQEFDFLKVYQIESKQGALDTYPELIDFTSPPADLFAQAQEQAQIYGQINLENYNLKSPQNWPVDLTKLKLEPLLCSPSSENQIFGLKPAQRGFALFGQNALVCTKIPLDKILTKRPMTDFLLKISFANQDQQALFCLTRKNDKNCLLSREEDNGFYFEFAANREIKDYELQFLLKTQSQEKETLVEKIEISIFPAFKKPALLAVENLEIRETIKYSSLRQEVRDTFSFTKLEHNQSYGILIEAENESGLPLRFCLTNSVSKRCDLYDNLKNGQNLFFLPPMGSNGQGYDVNLSNYAIGPIPSINLLKSIKIIPLDYEFIKSQSNSSGKYLTNNQSFEKNWGAFEYQGGLKIKSLGRPEEINGWENGWLVTEPPQGEIVFFFWPQLLQYLGFFLIFLFIVLMVIF